MDGDRDRTPALARHRHPAHRRRRRTRQRRPAGSEPHELYHHLRSDAHRLHGGAHPPRRPGRRPARRRQGRGIRRESRRVTLDLPLIFTILMGVAILAYVVLDGYDLGVGMLMPAAEEREQSAMVASIGPFWDANETWLVLGIGLLLVAFPAAHGIILG